MGNTLNFGIEVEVTEISVRFEHEVLDEIHREIRDPEEIGHILESVDDLADAIRDQIEGGEGSGTAEHTEGNTDYSAEWSIVSIWAKD